MSDTAGVPAPDGKPIVTGGLAAFRRALLLLGRAETVVAVAAFTAAVLINVAQIVLRYLMDLSIWWQQEVSLLLMLIAYFVGSAVVFRHRHYVVVGFLVDLFPPALQRACYLLAQALILAFWLVVSIQVAGMAPHMMRTYTVILHIPQYAMTVPLLVAGVSIALTTVYYALAFARAGRFLPDAPIAVIERRVRIDPAGAARLEADGAERPEYDGAERLEP